MCRMLFAVSKDDLPMPQLIESMRRMAQDQNERHENNKDQLWEHDSGWGIAYWQEGQWKTSQSLQPFYADEGRKDYEKLKTKAVILHARKASQGAISLDNTHPFSATLGEETFVFAHNGDIQDQLSYAPNFSPKGQTDSERYFYSMLSCWRTKAQKGIADLVLGLKNFTGANFIFCTPLQAWIGVRFTRKPNYGTMKAARGSNLIIVSSEVLPNFRKLQWQPVKNEEMIGVSLTSLGARKMKMVEVR